MFNALAAESAQNLEFVGAAAGKHDAHEGRNAPSPAGLGASKRFCIAVLAKLYKSIYIYIYIYISKWGGDWFFVEIYRRCISRKCPLARNRNTFPKTFVSDLSSRVARLEISI